MDNLVYTEGGLHGGSGLNPLLRITWFTQKGVTRREWAKSATVDNLYTEGGLHGGSTQKGGYTEGVG